MQRALAVSAVSLFPWCLGKCGYRRSQNLAKKGGFDGIQALPIRGWEKMKTKPGDYIPSFEKERNSGSLWQALMRSLQLADDPYPTFADWLLFGSNPNKAYQKIRWKSFSAIEIHHSLEKAGVVEVCPEAGLSHAIYIHHRFGVTWDTFHVRRAHRQTGEKIPHWRVLLENMPPGHIKLIHIHPTRSEVEGFIEGERQLELNQMLTILSNKTDCPAVLEVAPYLSLMLNPIVELQKLHKAMVEVFD